MEFKIKNTSVKLSFSFVALVLLFIISEKGNLYYVTFVNAFFHELVHIFFIIIFKGKINEFKISIFGGEIKRNDFNVSNIKNAVMYISAPFFNIFLGLFFLFLTKKTSNFVVSNLILGFFNMIPFYSFDGGCFLESVLLCFYSENKTEKIITTTSLIIAIVFILATILIVFRFKEGAFLIIFSLYMIFALIFKK